ncbi:MAG: aminodeoxychorismate synthase component I [Desulfamplus sp.]|nr:aminodeoxychorismate synthase component I [Desulfamplus sp.]
MKLFSSLNKSCYAQTSPAPFSPSQIFERGDNIIPSIKIVNRSKFKLTEPFEEAVKGFATQEGTVLLLSGTSLDCARYNILATKPLFTITAKGENILFYIDGKSFAFSGDPLEFVDKVVKKCTLDVDDKEPLYPVSSGLFGYLAYDLKDRIETLPNTCIDHQNLPDLYLVAPSIIFVHDRHTEFVDKIILGTDCGINGVTDFGINHSTNLRITKIDCESENSKNTNSDDSNYSTSNFKSAFSIDPNGFTSNFSKPEYIEAVKKIIEYIKAGDIYQVNLSQRFSAKFQGDPYTLFLNLFKKNPAPFFSFVNAGDHQIVSTSPERFIKRDGDKIETRPIKGTIQRGKSALEDKLFGETLLNSFKDDAELSMIVDLMRNDFGKVAVGGTVKVKEHKRLEPYDNVFHLVSIVEATIASDKSTVDLIRATFPGGSITGCPKIRSMEIIDELESVKRHVYTGSIGYISFHDTLDLSIAIRTAVVAGGKISFSVGGGIVFDSDPEKEYEETLHKGKTIMEIFNSSATNKNLSAIDRFDEKASVLSSNVRAIEHDKSIPPPDKKAWFNGKIVDEKDVVISANSIGFQYGAGLFETMRCEKGKVLRLNNHLKRISLSWKTLFKQNIPHINSITWHSLIENLIKLNGLEDKTAAVKLIVAEPDFVAVFTRQYIHRLESKSNKNSHRNNTLGCNERTDELDEPTDGLDLITFPEKRETPLAAHKSLNYLYYYLASLFAKQNGYDEALICNADGTVSETNTAAIIAVSVSEHEVIIPESDYTLPSITLDAALKLFLNAGYKITKREIMPSELVLMQNVIVLNSLMGAVKVLSIDGRKILHADSYKISHTNPHQILHSSENNNKSNNKHFESNGSNDLCGWLNWNL